MSGTSDEAMLAELRILAGRNDPLPPSLRTAARASLRWAALDKELATLVYDSYLDDDDARAGVRSLGGSRQLTFESPQVTVEVEVTVTAIRRIVGQLVPPGRASVVVRHRDGTVELEADELGRFACEQVPAGPFSLRCAAASGVPVETDWVVI